MRTTTLLASILLSISSVSTFAQGALRGTTLNLSGNAVIGGTVTSSGFVGNASTATALQTSRTINGIAFDGTSNIVVTAAAGTLTGTTLNSSVTGSSLTTFGTLAGHLLFTDNTYDIGASGATRPRTGYFGTSVFSPRFDVASGINWRSGTGSPEGAVTANVGALYSQDNGGAGTTLYVKESGTGNTGWVAYGAPGVAAAGTLTGTTLAANVVNSSLQTFGTLAGHLLFTDNTYDIGASGATRPRTGYFGTSVFSPRYDVASGINWRSGTGSPEGAITANVGALYSRDNGGAGTTLYVKESGTVIVRVLLPHKLPDHGLTGRRIMLRSGDDRRSSKSH